MLTTVFIFSQPRMVVWLWWAVMNGLTCALVWMSSLTLRPSSSHLTPSTRPHPSQASTLLISSTPSGNIHWTQTIKTSWYVNKDALNTQFYISTSQTVFTAIECSLSVYELFFLMCFSDGADTQLPAESTEGRPDHTPCYMVWQRRNFWEGGGVHSSSTKVEGSIEPIICLDGQVCTYRANWFQTKYLHVYLITVHVFSYTCSSRYTDLLLKIIGNDQISFPTVVVLQMAEVCIVHLNHLSCTHTKFIVILFQFTLNCSTAQCVPVLC